MGDIADQFLALFIILDLFLRRFLQPDPHLLKVLAKLADFVVILHIQSKIQISVPDLLGSLLQPSDGPKDRPVNPGRKSAAHNKKNDRAAQKHLQDHGTDLRDHVYHVCDQIDTHPAAVLQRKLPLLDQMLRLSIQVIPPGLHISQRFIIGNLRL